MAVSVGHQQGNFLTRGQAFAYLLVESLCLAEEARVLRQEFEALRHAPSTPKEAWVAFSHKLRAFSGLLQNHAIALKWAGSMTSKRLDTNALNTVTPSQCAINSTLAVAADFFEDGFDRTFAASSVQCDEPLVSIDP